MKVGSHRKTVRWVLVLGAVAVVVLATTLANATTSITATDVAPAKIKKNSAQVTVFGVDLTTNGIPVADTITSAKVRFDSISGFTTADLAADSGGTTSDGVQLWRDSSTTAGNQDVLDAADTAASSGFAFGDDCTDGSCVATFTIADGVIPAAADGSYTFFVAIRTSGTLSNLDAFTLTLPTDAFTTTPGPTAFVSEVTSKTITADTVSPSVPTVSALGLSTAAGKVRTSGVASAETSAVLEVWKASDATCIGGLTLVTEGSLTDLSVTGADVAGTTAAQQTAIQGIAATTEFICYRVRDDAGNLSNFAGDGNVPAAPSASDVALFGASNVTGLKRVYAAQDSSARSFRLYLRPGGTGLERAKSQTGVLLDVTTSASGPTNTGTTDIAQLGNSSTMAAGDGTAYSLVNSSGNDGSVTDDGSIPAVTTELSLLSVSDATGHERLVSGPDLTPGDVFGLYIDTAGGAAWTRAVSSSGGTTPVRVTTAATTADSGTEVFAGSDGTTPLAAAHAVGYVSVSSTGNESDAAADGTIPAAPAAAADLTFSDALNTFRVSTDPFPAATKIRLYVGDAGEIAADAYDGTPDGEATSNAPATVAEFAAAQTLYYTAFSTTSGNESSTVADGTIPAPPTSGVSSDLTLLATSAADLHQRVTSAADASPGDIFRLYLDTAGGTTWARAATASGGTVPVEVTTAGSAATSGTTLIFSGATQLAFPHAVGYARRDADGNDSEVTAEGAIPAIPAASATGLSDALNSFIASSATSEYQVNLHLGTAGQTADLAYSEAGSDGSATSTAAVSVADPALDATVFYSATQVSSGNESALVADGTVPGPPDATALGLLGVSAAQGNQRSTATTDASGPRTFRLYADPAGGTAWTRGVTTSGGSAPVEVVTSAAGAASSPTVSVFAGSAGTTSLAATHAVGHAFVSANGNDSEVSADGTIPAALDVATTSATAANDTVTATSASAAANVRVFKSTSSVDATAYGEGVDVTLSTSGATALDTTAGDKLYYTVLTTATGNESAIAADGSIPAAPDAATFSASDALDEFTVPGASSDTNIKIFLDPSSSASTAYANGVDHTATSSPWPAGGDLPSHNVFYTALTFASNNESAITADGAIPGAPTGVDSALSASAASGIVSATPDGGGPQRLRFYGDPAGLTAYVRATTTGGGSTPVELETSSSGSKDSTEFSAPGIFLSGGALTTGASIAYSRVTSGNDSDVVTDGTIPAAPVGPGNFSATAATGKATIAAPVASGTYRAFRGATPASIRVTHTTGVATTISGVTLVGGDDVGYAITETTNNNESPVLADGEIPVAPGASTLSASARTDTITATGATAADNVLAFISTSSDGPTAYDQGVDLTITSSAPAATTLTAADFLHYTVKNPASGNESAITSDGSIPAAPSLPAASTLVLAGDGGVGAPAATINSIGDSAATLRPAVALAAAGERVTLLVSDGATTVTGTATATAASVTPVFGGSTANVTYGSTGQDATTGSLDVSGLADGSLSVSGAKVDAGGNESETSSPIIVGKDTVAPDAPTGNAITPASPTNDNTPAVNGDADADTVSVRVTFDTTGTSNDRTIAVTPSSPYSVGDAQYGGTPLADGTYDVTATALDDAGNPTVTPATVVAGYVIDTVAPPGPDAPDLQAGSDLGAFDDDEVTSDVTPSFDITGGQAGQLVKLFVGGVEKASGTANGSGDVTLTSTALAAGTHVVTAKALDAAGNLSPASSTLSITLELAAPTTSLDSVGTITGGPTIQFSETVRGVDETNVVLKAGTTTITSSRKCLNSSGVVVTCGTGDVDLVVINPSSALVPGGTYTIEVAPGGSTPITDFAGNEHSAQDLGFRASRVEQENTVAARPGWRRATTSKALGGNYLLERKGGASAYFSFTGSKVTWYATQGPNYGIAHVYIDGVKKGTFNLYSPAARYWVGRSFVVPQGLHSIRIVVGGRKGTSAATDTVVSIDAFRVLNGATSTIFMTPTLKLLWRAVASSSASGGRYALSNLSASFYDFTFAGTGIDWYTVLGPGMGKAAVYIDGVLKLIVDNYYPTTRFGFRRLIRGLTDAQHTMHIVVLGQKRTASRGTDIAVDRWVVI